MRKAWVDRQAVSASVDAISALPKELIQGSRPPAPKAAPKTNIENQTQPVSGKKSKLPVVERVRSLINLADFRQYLTNQQVISKLKEVVNTFSNEVPAGEASVPNQ